MWGASCGVHHAGCITCGASRGVHHMGCIMCGASCVVHHMGASRGCITWGASCGVHHVGCIMWGATCGVHHVGCITWGASRGCITWGASRGVHHVGCITWGGCIRHASHPGVTKCSDIPTVLGDRGVWHFQVQHEMVTCCRFLHQLFLCDLDPYFRLGKQSPRGRHLLQRTLCGLTAWRSCILSLKKYTRSCRRSRYSQSTPRPFDPTNPTNPEVTCCRLLQQLFRCDLDLCFRLTNHSSEEELYRLRRTFCSYSGGVIDSCTLNVNELTSRCRRSRYTHLLGWSITWRLQQILGVGGGETL